MKNIRWAALFVLALVAAVAGASATLPSLTEKPTPVEPAAVAAESSLAPDLGATAACAADGGEDLGTVDAAGGPVPLACPRCGNSDHRCETCCPSGKGACGFNGICLCQL